MLIEKHIRYRIIRLLLVVLSPWCCCWTHYYCGIVGRCTGLLEFSTKPARAFSVPTISVHSRLASSTTTRRMASSSESDQRRPWDVIRFIQQSSRFVPSPFAPPRLGPVPQGKVKPQPGDFLWSPGSQNAFQFAPLDDVVMGGASASDFDNRLGIWKGRVTDANNGGFIGIRNTPYFDWDMSNCQGLEFTLKSPIRSGRYKIGLRDRKEFNGIVWNTSVDVSTSVTKIRIPFQKFKPTRFANIIDNETFRRDNVVGLQITYSKFEYDGKLNEKFSIGNVELQLLCIKAY